MVSYTDTGEEVAPAKYEYIDEEVNPNGMTRVTHAGGDSGAIEAFIERDDEMKKGGKAGGGKWIQGALGGHRGSLKKKAFELGLIRNMDENLSETDLKKLEKISPKRAKQANLARTLKAFDKGGEVDFRKDIFLGKVAYSNPNRKANAVNIKVEIKDKQDATDWETLKEIHNVSELSMSGAIWDARHSDHISAGQNLIEELFPENKKLKRLVEIWRQYHLNDLKSGTKKQSEAVEKWLGEDNKYDYTAALNYLKSIGLDKDRGYEYGTGWLYEPIPKSIVQEVKSLSEDLDVSGKMEQGGEVDGVFFKDDICWLITG